MPDLERLLRDLELKGAANPDLVKARHAGEDRARWEVLIVFLALLLAIFAVHALFLFL